MTCGQSELTSSWYSCEPRREPDTLTILSLYQAGCMNLAGQNLHHPGTAVNSGACTRMVHDLSKERTYIILVQL
jgi:hypothetical protein